MSFCCCTCSIYEHSKGDLFLLMSLWAGIWEWKHLLFFSLSLNTDSVLAAFILPCSIGTIVKGCVHKDLENIPVHSPKVTLFWILDAVISCVWHRCLLKSYPISSHHTVFSITLPYLSYYTLSLVSHLILSVSISFHKRVSLCILALISNIDVGKCVHVSVVLVFIQWPKS